MTKKALIIGINYYGQSYQLSGCLNDAANVRDFLVADHGFQEDSEAMVVMTDAPENKDTLLYPTRVNMLNALRWLVHDNQPGDAVWLSYSGHGGQTTDDNGNNPTQEEDTICPVDFEDAGQIDSAALHHSLVVPLHPQARLTILFDCCHSGSACALPYVYRPDEGGNISVTFTDVVQTLQEGAQLVVAAEQLAHAPLLLSLDSLAQAKSLLHGMTGFAKELAVVAETAIHGDSDNDGEPDEDGLVKVVTTVVTTTVAKDVWMFSGCADNQTSADTNIGGVATGAMSWAFLAAMRQTPPGELSYIGLLTATRQLLKDNYAQIPQLSCGGEYDLDQAIVVRHPRRNERSRIYIDCC